MKTWNDQGGPAFPAESNEHYFKGMTLRDWFAGQALAGFLASKSHSISFNPEDDANYVYCIADAMLLAREKDLAHKPTPE